LIEHSPVASENNKRKSSSREGTLNNTNFPNFIDNVLFERMMMEALYFMTMTVTIIAIAACLFYLAALLWLIRAEKAPLAKPKPVRVRPRGVNSGNRQLSYLTRVSASGSVRALRIQSGN